MTDKDKFYGEENSAHELVQKKASVPIRAGATEDDVVKAKAEVAEANARLQEAIARAGAEAAVGRDIAAEYESKYYGTPPASPAPPAPRVPQAPDVLSSPPPPPPPLPIPAHETKAYATPLTNEEERLWAALAHGSLMVTLLLSPFTGFALTPFLIFAPLVIYFAYRERSEFVAYHAMQAFAMQILMTIGYVAIGVGVTVALVVVIIVAAILSVVLIGIPFLLVAIVAIVLFSILWWPFMPPALAIYSLIAAWETNHGRNFRYRRVADWVDKYMVNHL